MFLKQKCKYSLISGGCIGSQRFLAMNLSDI